ncbi:MAG: 4-hydroxythreonine-4-phosphate dehydrogenase PdxA [Desulfobacterales bacterium]
MERNLPDVGITMGDPVGIGPEIILRALDDPSIHSLCNPFVIGDIQILTSVKHVTGWDGDLHRILTPEDAIYRRGSIDVMSVSSLNPSSALPGLPTIDTGRAMVSYITTAIDWALRGKIAAVVTSPINKAAMKLAGFSYRGHTELFAEKTQSDNIVMMLAGNVLRVVLVTRHEPLKQVSGLLTVEKITNTIAVTHQALTGRFGIDTPLIAVAGLNPHAGEQGLLGDEEDRVIIPAIEASKKAGIHVVGPLPPDTAFHYAAKGTYDVVVCMYHDQGLIPFKMMHFSDGVNTTLGLPIIRTSVDHGTAYDIAGTGKADPGSLIAAIKMAAEHALSEQITTE